MEAYRRARVTDEPHITDRLMGAVETTVRSLGRSYSSSFEPDADDLALELPIVARSGGPSPVARGGMVWEAMTLRAGSHSAAHEKRFGADILGVLSIETPEYTVSKGFVAQAKRAEPGVSFNNAEWIRLQRQCELMLSITPDAFVLIYSKERGVRMVSALAVSEFSGHDLFALYDMALRTFFERHIESFIGDRRLNAPRIDVLESIRFDTPTDEHPSRHVLHLKASIAE